MRLAAHSRASVRMTRASTPDSSAAHSGVLGWPSVSPRMYSLNSSKPMVRSRDVVLVVGVFGDPHVGDGHGHGRVGALPRGDPLAPHHRVGVVVEGVDEDHLDALLLEPLPPEGRILAGVGAAGGVRVVGPVDDHLRVLQGVLQHVVRLGHAQPPVEAIAVGRAPVPAFPAIGIVQHRGAFDHVHEAGEGPHLVAHDAPVVMRGGQTADGRPAVGLLDPLDLAGDQSRVPRPRRCAHRATCPGSAGCARRWDRSPTRFMGYLMRSSE